MKKLVRLLALTLVLAGSYSAFSTSTTGVRLLGGGGDPVPLCDPSNPNCTMEPK